MYIPRRHQRGSNVAPNNRPDTSEVDGETTRAVPGGCYPRLRFARHAPSARRGPVAGPEAKACVAPPRAAVVGASEVVHGHLLRVGSLAVMSLGTAACVCIGAGAGLCEQLLTRGRQHCHLSR